MIKAARGLTDVAALAKTDDVFAALHQAFLKHGVGDGANRHCIHFGVPRHPVLIFEGFLDINHDKESGTRLLEVEVDFDEGVTALKHFGVREIRAPSAPVQFVIRWKHTPLPTKSAPRKYNPAFKRFYSTP